VGPTASADDLERRKKYLVHARDQTPERLVQGKRLLNWALDLNVQLITQLTVARYGAVCTVLNEAHHTLKTCSVKAYIHTYVTSALREDEIIHVIHTHTGVYMCVSIWQCRDVCKLVYSGRPASQPASIAASQLQVTHASS